MYLKNFIEDLCFPRILEKIYRSTYKFNNKRVDAMTTTFLLFTSQVCFFFIIFISHLTSATFILTLC